MLINDIEPIGNPTTELNDDNLIDQIIELPLRESCRIFKDKGIQTIMSSANKNNVLKDGMKSFEKDDLGSVMDSHYFTEAGNGYAWIMINYNSLDDDNKRLLFSMEETLGDNLVWFVHPFVMTGNIEYGIRSGKFSHSYLKQCIGEDQIPKGIEFDKSLEEFDKRHVVMLYPWEETTEIVLLRMPISKDTTVEEVNDYFVKLANLFKSQVIKFNTGNVIK